MDKIGLFYGTVSSATRYVAEMIKSEFGADRVDVINMANAKPTDVAKYDRLIIGAPTWDSDTVETDLRKFLAALENLDLTGKQVALFGLGDQKLYPGKFLDTMGKIYQKVQQRGARVIGRWPTEGYKFKKSKAVDGHSFVGLALDEDNQSQYTIDRVELWVEILRLTFDKER